MMVTTHQILRSRLLRKVLEEESSRYIPSLDSLRHSEWCPEFERLMRNRLIMGAFRYELFSDKSESFNYDTASEVIERVKRYKKDGNTEHLVDAANMCLLEFKFGHHPKKHFKSIDDGSHVEKIGD